MVDFKLPAISPQSDSDEEAFTELEEIISPGTVSSAIGWAIETGQQLQEHREEICFLFNNAEGGVHWLHLQELGHITLLSSQG